MMIGLAVPAAARAEESARDETPTLKGGQEGTSLGDMTVEGEDRIRVTFARPSLDLSIDPHTTAGLAWDVRRQVLERGGPDPLRALLDSRTGEIVPRLARPWLDGFTEGGVARFRPDLTGVSQWSLEVADSRGATVAVFEGKGNPEPMMWNGRTLDGQAALPGLTYSFGLTAYDEAGNKRTFVGDGFAVPPYRASDDEGWSLLFAGNQMGSDAATSPLLRECADRVNRVGGDGTVRVVATARSHGEAEHLAELVSTLLAPRILGDPARVRPEVRVQPDAPASGAVEVRVENGS
jgi:hypothetical protein